MTEESQLILMRRIRVFREEWEALASVMGFDSNRLYLNQDLLMELVASYFRHLQTFKDDQGIKKADRHKSGGFMMHWICRCKPVQVLVKHENTAEEPLTEVEMLANELFAIHAGISCLDAVPDLVGDFDFFGSLIKRLREKECPAEFLSSMLYLYERLRTAV